MKLLMLAIIVAACVMLGASMVFIESGILRDAVILGLGAFLGFLVAYQIQKRFSVLK